METIVNRLDGKIRDAAELQRKHDSSDILVFKTFFTIFDSSVSTFTAIGSIIYKRTFKML
jgi:hypothetical protein